MSSLLKWLDTSESDRRRALDVIDLFSVRDTRDELGLGGVRDAWADRLVPGTSTIQTRARYFFFIPWVYLKLEHQRVGAPDVRRKARKAELDLVVALIEADEGGVPIGAVAKRGLKRLPSDIYWAGLKRLGIRLFDGSQSTYQRAFGRQVLGEDQLRGAWNPHLPAPPKGFPQEASLRLERKEAEFLRDQVRAHAPGTLLAFLMACEGHWEGAAFPWEHAMQAEMPDRLRAWLGHAERFAVTVHGAALLYNLMLAEKIDAGLQSGLDGGELVERYQGAIHNWAADVRALGEDLGGWDRPAFWQLTREANPNIAERSVRFGEAWIDMVMGAPDAGTLMNSASARELIERREFALKKGRSRLRYREHLERWGGKSGASRIDYRWDITQRLVRDVQEGLGNL
jgi:hypothetical protein